MAKDAPRKADQADAESATPPSAQPVHQAGDPGADPEGPGAPQPAQAGQKRPDETRPGGYYLNAAGQPFDAEGRPIKGGAKAAPATQEDED